MAVDNIARGMAAKALENQGGGGSSLPIVNTASVGQTIRVSAVDETGKPTEWEAVDIQDGLDPNLLDYVLVREVELYEEASKILVNTLLDGSAFEYKKARVCIYFAPTATNAAKSDGTVEANGTAVKHYKDLIYTGTYCTRVEFDFDATCKKMIADNNFFYAIGIDGLYSSIDNACFQINRWGWKSGVTGLTSVGVTAESGNVLGVGTKIQIFVPKYLEV